MIGPVDVAPLLLDLYGRTPPLAREAVDGLGPEDLTWVPTPGANPIGWLLWHMGRVLDAEFAGLTGADQLWTTGDWAGHFGLDPDPSNTGYGHTPEQVAAVRPDGAEALLEYLEAAHARARGFVEGLSPDELDRIVDRSWDPPVTLGVRLVSLADDGLQHVGQAAYLRGLLERS
jgi:hypothetical protein